MRSVEQGEYKEIRLSMELCKDQAGRDEADHREMHNSLVPGRKVLLSGSEATS